MKTLKTVEITTEFVDTVIPEVMEENKLYISLDCEVSIHLCLCGCKNEVVIPFGPGGWKYTENDGKITLSPSIGNYSLPCKSHYIITKNKANFV